MRPIEEVFEQLRQDNIRIWLEAGKLRYRAPKGVLRAGLKEELRARKEEIIARLPPQGGWPGVVPDLENRHSPFPLTDIQQAYWVGRNGAFELGDVGVHGYLEIENDFDMDRLQSAWNKVIDRHEMLRAILLPTGEQRVLEKVPEYRIVVKDCRESCPDDRARHLDVWRKEMSHQMFSGETWPLFDIRATLLEQNKARLHVSLDLLMADLWSLFIIFQDWANFIEDPGFSPKPLEISFRDYVIAENAFRQTMEYKEDEKYWMQRVASLPLGPELPVAVPAENIANPEFRRFSARLEPDAWRTLCRRAAQYGLTPSGVLLAAYAEVMGRWSKSSHYNLNLTLFNRAPVHEQINEIVGDFTTTVLLEVKADERASFIDRAKRLQEQLWEDLDHRSVSAVRVVREIVRSRNVSRAVMPVVFSSALGIDSLDDGSPQLGKFGTQIGDVVCTISQTPQVWIDHQAIEDRGGLFFNWDGVECIFPDGVLADMFGAYRDFLGRLAESETEWTSLSRELLPTKQMQRREDVNATRVDLQKGLLHELFFRQCDLRPGSIAVVHGSREISYAELGHCANQIGYSVRDMGAQANTLVAICMEKGWEQLAATLGVLASGAAYVPIDPELPEERRWKLLQDADCRIVLCQERVKRRLSWPPDVKVHVVSEDIIQEKPLPRIETVQQWEDLAYVIYTSGSTGMPKGVMIDHRGAVNTIVDINRRFGVSEKDSVLALSSLSFDLSVYDIFGLLAAGGRIIIPEANSSRDAAHWMKLVTERRVSIWNSVPALFQMLVEHATARKGLNDTSLRLAMLSGDWIPVTLPDRARRICDGVKIVSLGGATEASIWSIFYPVAEVAPEWASIPYGKPLSNQSYHVLNDALEPCPDWVTGQLYIGGTGLAIGYWNDAAKTQASFIIHPQTGERLYRTGDLGRYLPDGNIEFLGREDFQVKINGYRIELGEIEAALVQHPTVREAVVTTTDRAGDARQLVAYLVSSHASAAKKNGRDLQVPAAALSDVDKLDFKLKRKGIRAIGEGQRCIDLQSAEPDDAVKAAYIRHRAYRSFKDAELSCRAFSDFLSALRCLEFDEGLLPKYLYPSAGSLYPVQTYLYVKPGRIASVEGGLYYYHPDKHGLVSIAAAEDMHRRMSGVHDGPNAAIYEQSAFALFSIGELDAIEPLYGEWARDFCLIEGGYIGQLLMDRAPDHNIGLCPIGKVHFDDLRELFAWSKSQIFVQGFLGGLIDDEQVSRLSFASAARTDPEELRTFLRSKLPEHMVPSVYVAVDSLPLTANGKVNRNELPEVGASASKEAAVSKPPETDLEKRIAAIVAEALGCENVGINSNFFDLGGDSVAIVRLNNKLSEEFSRDIPVVEMFRYPTVGYLAELLGGDHGQARAVDAAVSRAEKIRRARQRRKQA